MIYREITIREAVNLVWCNLNDDGVGGVEEKVKRIIRRDKGGGEVNNNISGVLRK